jgi:uncharacterized protein YcaQ
VSGTIETLSVDAARRLALARAGLLTPETTGLPRHARGRGKTAFAAAYEVVARFGYLQLDTVSVAGARSHAIVLLSRLSGLDSSVGEELLTPGAPVFEYWGHEASWIPSALYPAFEFRRREFRRHPWWGDLVAKHPRVAADLLRRIREEGPLRSSEIEGRASRGFWDLGVTKRVASALWSSGELAIRERRSFQRTYDLAERVIPEKLRRKPLPAAEGIEALLLQALLGHGWATAGTLAATWRLRNRKSELAAALERLLQRGMVVRCALAPRDGRTGPAGFVRPADLELAARLERARPRGDRGVLLSPFDPVLWDRPRVARLFGFDACMEIFKPRSRRVYGYYCLPVLAGERLVARVDLKADRRRQRLRVLTAQRPASPWSAMRPLSVSIPRGDLPLNPRRPAAAPEAAGRASCRARPRPAGSGGAGPLGRCDRSCIPAWRHAGIEARASGAAVTVSSIPESLERQGERVMSWWLTFVMIGGLGGVVAGIFGIGGGIVIVPALIYWAGFSQHKATGTSLAALLLPIGLGAVAEYYRNGNVDLRAGAVLAVTMFAGAWLGAVIANHMKGPHLRLAFGLFVCAMGVYLVHGACKRLGWL